jgi:uncharacterized Ntn-hydrolase superfamily protein
VTYSIVATDRDTGAMGVAVQSHWFSVGSIVTWAQPGVGAVATQANVEPAYGPRALEAMRAGAGARDALGELVARDELRHVRQVAVADRAGEVAAHTGEECMRFAGHVLGDGFSCQGNIMATPDVWPAMARAFEAAGGALVHRLLAALEAGETAGGDVRGRQSAAVTVVAAAGDAWERTVDLRVEDHPEPLRELRRLVVLHDAYGEAAEGDRLVGEGDPEAAAARYVAAYEIAPECVELEFWAGLSMLHAGDGERGLEHVRAAVRRRPGFGELLTRLTPEDAPAAAQAVRALGLDR